MKCPNCHTDNRDSAKFCDECGFPLQGKIAEVAAAAETADGQASEEELTETLREAAKAAEAIEPDESFSRASTQSIPKIDLANPTGESVELEAVDLRPKPSSSGPISEESIPEIEATEEADDSDSVLDVAQPTIELPKESLVNVLQLDAEEDESEDLSGLDESIFGMPITDAYGERVVSEKAAKQKNNWRDGATMKMPKIEGEDEPETKDFKASSTVKKSPKKKAIIIGVVIAIVVVLAAVAGITYGLEIWGGKSVPDVSGMTQSEATKVLEASGFTVRATQVKSDDTEGLVLLMDPEANSRAAEGSEVVIHITVARSIPDIVGKTEADAVALIEAEGFEKVTYVKKNSDEVEGTILDVSPAAGTRAKAKTEITVTVAQPYTVPDISNISVEEARTAISDAGLNPYVVNVESESYPEGTVIGTNPSSGVKVAGGSDVAIQVAVHRSSELIAATQSLIYSGATITIDGTNYYVTSLDDVQYLGEDRTSFTMTASGYVYLLGEMIMGSPRSVSGTIQWTSDNQVSSIS